MTQIVGAFVATLAGAAQKRCTGLAWKSGRGLRSWQMYTGVSWEPGRAQCFLPVNAGWGYPGYQNPGIEGSSRPSTSRGSGTRIKGTKEGITLRETKEVRRALGSLSTLIVPIESRETYPKEPVSRKGEYRVMESLLGNAFYTRR